MTIRLLVEDTSGRAAVWKKKWREIGKFNLDGNLIVLGIEMDRFYCCHKLRLLINFDGNLQPASSQVNGPLDF